MKIHKPQDITVFKNWPANFILEFPRGQSEKGNTSSI